MNQEQFEFIKGKIREKTGIVIQDHKEIMVKSRIFKRMNKLGISNINDYMMKIDDDDEIMDFCNAVTTNLTSFFRENHHFEHLANEIKQKSSAQKIFRIWSAACSTGEEPYSIAMTVEKLRAESPHFEWKILATDIDTEVLSSSMSGEYSNQKLEKIPREMKEKFFKINDSGDQVVSDSLKENISFRRMNFFHPWPKMPRFDFIFCRNVLIYFDTEAKNQIIDKFTNCLTMNGVLYLGHSETIMDGHASLSSEGKTTYRKVAG